MGVIGAFLIVLGFILGIISIIYILESEWNLAITGLILAILCAGIGVWFIKLDGQDDGQNDEYVTVVTSDYKVLDQSQMYITNGDTVIHKRYIIKYKK